MTAPPPTKHRSGRHKGAGSSLPGSSRITCGFGEQHRGGQTGRLPLLAHQQHRRTDHLPDPVATAPSSAPAGTAPTPAQASPVPHPTLWGAGPERLSLRAAARSNQSRRDACRAVHGAREVAGPLSPARAQDETRRRRQGRAHHGTQGTPTPLFCHRHRDGVRRPGFRIGQAAVRVLLQRSRPDRREGGDRLGGTSATGWSYQGRGWPGRRRGRGPAGTAPPLTPLSRLIGSPR